MKRFVLTAKGKNANGNTMPLKMNVEGASKKKAMDAFVERFKQRGIEIISGPHVMNDKKVARSSKTKQCTKCGEVKPVSEFYRDISTVDGWKQQCKNCLSKQVRERRLRKKDQEAMLTAPRGEMAEQLNMNNPVRRMNINGELYINWNDLRVLLRDLK